MISVLVYCLWELIIVVSCR